VAFNFRLNLQSVFRRLGIQSGARLPQLEQDVRMVMVITDLSRLIPAPIEPRGLAGANIAGVVGQRSYVQLQALSPGGTFVEAIVFRGPTVGVGENQVLNVSDQDLGLPLFPNLNIGGTPILSRFTAGPHAVVGGGVTFPAPQGFEQFGFPLGIFIPNQSFLSVRPGFDNRRLDISILYRELPSIEEAG